MTDTDTRKPRFTSAQKIFLGLGLGVLTGIFFGEMVGWLRLVGDIFIRLLQITVIPYISLVLITGLGSLSYAEVKALALKGGRILLLLWLLAILMVVLVPLAYPDWVSASFFSTSQLETPQPPDFFRLFIPSNPFHAYANALVPAVVVFSILLGLALIAIPEREALLAPLAATRDALMKVTGFIGRLAPYGVFALMASMAGTFDIGDLARLQVHIVLTSLSLLVLALWVFPALVTVFTPLPYREILQALKTPLITGFATGSTLVVLPMLIEQCRELIAKASSFDEEKQEAAEASVKVLIATAFPFPAAGNLLAVLLFVLFAGWFVGSNVSMESYPLLILTGIPSLFGGTLLAIPFLLDLMQLPSDLFQVFISADIILTRFGTLLNVMYFGSLALIGSFALTTRLHFDWKRFTRFAVLSTALLATLIIGVRAFYTHVVVVPFTKNDALRGLSLLGEAQPIKPVELQASQNEPATTGPAGFQTIFDRGVLRVCYQPNEFPSAFYNSATPPQLVGFDIEMAHRLARRRNLAVAFLPTEDENEAAAYLNSGACDIYMRSLPISAGRAQQFGLTASVFQSALGLVVKDYRRHDFRSWEQLRERGNSLRVGVEGSRESLLLMSGLLPEATLYPIADMAEKDRILEAGGEYLDAIADMAEEGAAWALLFPTFSGVVPRPTVFIPVAYAVARENQDLLVAINAWLAVEQANGTIDQLYDYWMLGGAIVKTRPPRWSVIRDVLGWVD